MTFVQKPPKIVMLLTLQAVKKFYIFFRCSQVIANFDTIVYFSKSLFFVRLSKLAALKVFRNHVQNKASHYFYALLLQLGLSEVLIGRVRIY